MKYGNCVKLAAEVLLASAFAVSMPLSFHASATSLTLTKGTATLLESSANFAGIVHDGSRIVVSYGKGNELYIRPFDTNFNALAAATRLTSVGNVTDHKHIFFQNAHYLLYSTRGDDDLYLIKVDKNFVQAGTTVTVALNSTTTRTNDMLLTTDGTYIFTGQFRPSDLNRNEGSGHLIKRYDANLANVAPDFTANAYPHTNTASTMPLGNGMIIVAPSNPVFGGQVQTQRDLLLLRFDSSYRAVDTSAKKLVDSRVPGHDALSRATRARSRHSKQRGCGQPRPDGVRLGLSSRDRCGVGRVDGQRARVRSDCAEYEYHDPQQLHRRLGPCGDLDRRARRRHRAGERHRSLESASRAALLRGLGPDACHARAGRHAGSRDSLQHQRERDEQPGAGASTVRGAVRLDHGSVSLPAQPSTGPVGFRR